MGHSIITNLDRDSIIAEIELLAGTLDFNCKVIIVVEGQDDVKFLQLFTKEENVTIVESYSGKNGVYDIVDSCDYQNVICICDRDYEQVSNSGRKFYYDTSCLEIMLISNTSASEKVFKILEMNEEVFIEVNGLINNLVKNLSFISNLRKLNFSNGLGINFNVLKYSNYYGENLDLIAINLMKLLSSAPNEEIYKNNHEVIKNVLNNPIADINLTNGHDLVSAIAYHSKRKRSKDVVFELYLTSYERKYIEHTILYTDLQTKFIGKIF